MPADVQPVPRRLVIYWRITFWAIVIHLVFPGLPVLYNFSQEARVSELISMPAPVPGHPDPVAYWMLLNTPWVWMALMASDLGSLWLAWRLMHGRRCTWFLPLHLCGVIGLAGTHAWLNQYSSPGHHPSAYLLANTLLAAPAMLILLGVITPPRTKPLRPGICHVCGYDLRATPDRCPECGAPAAAAMAQARRSRDDEAQG